MRYKMKILYLLSAILIVFGLFVALWIRQPLGFVVSAAGLVMFIYFFMTGGEKNKKK